MGFEHFICIELELYQIRFSSCYSILIDIVMSYIELKIEQIYFGWIIKIQWCVQIMHNLRSKNNFGT